MITDGYLEAVENERSNKQYIEKSFIDLPKGHRTFEIQTQFGVFAYCFNVEKMKFDFETMSKTFVAMFNNIPVTPEEIVKLRLLPDDAEILSMGINFNSEAEINQVRKTAQKAFDYFNDNLASMFGEVIERFIYESFALGVIRADNEYYVLSVSESEFFSSFSKIINKSMRGRMKIKNMTKKPIIWTSEKLLNLLDSYENIHELIKKARKFYKDGEDDSYPRSHSREVKIVSVTDRVKLAFPELEEATIDDFKYKDKTNNILAIEALIKRLDLNLEVSSVSSLLVNARAERKKADKPKDEK